MVEKLSVPKCAISKNIASRNPKSPMRLTMNAFLPASAADCLGEIESDQQVRRQAHTLPPDKHQQEVLRQHQHRHEEHEEVEIREEAPVALFIRHVADRIDVNQKSNARHHAQHHQRQLIEREGKVSRERRSLDPRARQLLNIGKRRLADVQRNVRHQQLPGPASPAAPSLTPPRAEAYAPAAHSPRSRPAGTTRSPRDAENRS